MYRIYHSLIPLLVSVMFFSCASEKPPTGGPKDHTIPKLISTFPKNKSVNFNAQEITLGFDENIDVNQFNQNVFISPRTEVQLKPVVRKKEVTLKIQGDLKANTTYTIFFNNCIKDITEGNKIPNFTYTFSTGTYLDTNYIKGSSKVISTNATQENASIMLYPYSDTLDITKHKPEYFCKTKKQGLFKLENIPIGKYLIYYINDLNNNLLYDPEEEVSFITEPIQLDSNLTNIDFRVFKHDAIAPTVKETITKNHIRLTFSETIKNIRIQDTTGKPMHFPYVSNADQSEFSFYYTIPTDSQFVQFIYSDVNNNTDTSKYMIYNPILDTNKSDKIDIQLVNIVCDPEDSIYIMFNHPVSSINPEQIHIFSDTTETGLLKAENYRINQNILSIYVNTKASHYVGLYFDSLALIGQESGITNRKLKLTPGIADKTKKGSISGRIDYEGSDIVMELLNAQNKVIKSTREKTFQFINMEPSTYSIQIKFDENKNGIYDKGNFSDQTLPEKIFFHNPKINLRANWEIEDIIISPVE